MKELQSGACVTLKGLKLQNPSCVAAERQAAVVKCRCKGVTRVSHTHFCSVSLSESPWNILPCVGCLSQDTSFVSAMRFFFSSPPPFSLWATRNDARKRQKETEWRQRSRVWDKMQSCKCHVQTQTPVSQCYFIPPLFKPVNSMLYVCFLFSVTCCIKSHTVETKKKNHKMTKK